MDLRISGLEFRGVAGSTHLSKNKSVETVCRSALGAKHASPELNSCAYGNRKSYYFGFKNNYLNPTFCGYYGDPNPLKKLFWIVSGRNAVYEDDWTKNHLYHTGYYKWVNANPS